MIRPKHPGFIASGLMAALFAHICSAAAFPFIDATNTNSVPASAPAGTDLPSTDQTGLQNQLRLTNPQAPGNPSGWTIIPRFTAAELLTDNARNVTSPREFDAVTYLAPGVAVTADTRRLQLQLDYAPSLAIHAVEGPLNALTQNLNMIGTVTLVPDLLFIDIRGLSGVQARFGGLAGSGTLGALANASLAPAGSLSQVATYGGQTLNSTNQVQTSSFGVSPYLLRKIQDFGTLKLGVSANVANYNQITGFAASPISISDLGGENLVTTEQIAQFTTGEYFGKFQNSLTVNISQSQTHTAATGTIPSSTTRSDRQLVNNQLSYAINHTFTLLASFGEQSINYNHYGTPAINGPTWSVGVTATPGPDSSFTLSYGHLNGTDTLLGNAYMAVGGRTFLSASYNSSVGTQLENLQNQLNSSAATAAGSLVNAATGGPAFIAINGLGVQQGVYRFNTFNTSLSTYWLRDTLQGTLTWSQQTSLSPTYGVSSINIDFGTGAATINYEPTGTSGQSTELDTASIVWMHELSPELSLSASAAYSYIRRSNGLGNDESLTTALGVRYLFPSGSSLNARYSFFDRVSRIPGYTLYENLVLFGFTKIF